ncbi:hypothetical protein FB390_5194 [Nocardia bhagyanarayanae]|uniref:Signal transduction histidine kinase n=2 Tax=Nocardia bhagyanarayanae TaxID=1215925 RepID=A0A543FIC3_9NOCA|nr:hypothetical protein FB390_5194 [Nocardia bhagyanarayanae]
MTSHPDDPQDVRDVLGMRTPAAWGLYGLFVATMFTMAFSATEGVRHVWVMALAAAVLAVAGLGVIVAPGDPLRHRYAAPMAAAAPIGAVLGLSQLPVPIANATQLWFLGAASAYLNFMCIRAASAWAWAALAAQVVVCTVWTANTRQGFMTGLGFSFINAAPLLMATFFSRVVRPMAQSILSLRRQAAERSAAEAAAEAGQQERDTRLNHLDNAARPLLETIASGRPLSAAEQEQCQLLEAELRDEILGGRMVDRDIMAAARKARGRGVAVVLDDGGGLDAAGADLTGVVRSVVRRALDHADSGEVIARVLPPGRDLVASVLLRGATELRIEVEPTGTVRSDLDAEIFSGANQDPEPAGREVADF